jgi:HD-GYP domain-containing protein (c-di-GMP phosphodiesterase class II)
MVWIFAVDSALTPIALLAALGCSAHPALVVFTLPLIGLLAYFARERQVRIDHALELSHAYRGTAMLLGDVVEADDAYTGSHSRDVISLVLTDDEWAIMKTHTVEGERLLSQVGGILGNVGRIVRSCHEDWDGTGYPDGLVAEEIPLVARIVRACDAFSDMTTDRSYRKARPVEEAIAELRRCAGTDFDPVVVDALAESVTAEV